MYIRQLPAGAPPTCTAKGCFEANIRVANVFIAEAVVLLASIAIQGQRFPRGELLVKSVGSA